MLQVVWGRSRNCAGQRSDERREMLSCLQVLGAEPLRLLAPERGKWFHRPEKLRTRQALE